MDEIESFDTTLSFLEEALNECGDIWEDAGGDMGSSDASVHPQTPIIKVKARKRKALNHNKGRKELQAELVRLRMELKSLEFTLQRLQEIKGKRRRTNNTQSSDNKSGGVWREACGRQLEQRLRAERENLHLRKKCEREEQVAKRLENLLYKRPARWEMTYPKIGDGFHTKRIEVPAGYMNQTAALIFDELSASVKDCYRAITAVGRVGEMDAIATRRPLLRDNMDGGTRMEVVDNTILPFNMVETGEAWWEVWHEFRGQCGHDKTDDVVTESFGLEIRDIETGTSATFYVQQILHRYVEEDQILYVWNMYTEPFLFKNKRVHGMYYREKSYVLIKPVEMHGEVNPCSRMLASEDIKAQFLDPKTKKDARIAALTKHVAKSMPPYITMRNEAVESFLLDRKLQSRCT